MACLSQDPEWQEWRINLQGKALTEGAAALLVAALHRFCAAEKATDPQEVYLSLQDLGKRLCAEALEPKFLESIADVFNRYANGRYRVKVPKIRESTGTEMDELPARN